MQRRALASAFCRSLPPGGPVSSALTSLAAELPLCTHPDQSPAYPLWRLDNRRDFHALSQAHLLAPRSPQLPSPLPSLRYAATSSAQASTPATVADLTIAMQEALDSKRFESALAMFRASDGHLLLPATHRNPTAVASVYDCALKACAAGGAADDALKLMATMWRRKVPVGRIAQGSVLKALCTAGRREEALRHLKSISKTRLTTVMFNTVLGACAASHDAAVGLRCWELMRKREVPPDAVTFCEVMRLHGAAGQASEIQSVWDTAVNTLGIETSISTEANVGDDGHRSMLTAAQAGALATAGDFSAATAACEALMESMSHCLPVPLHFDVAGLPSAGDEGAGGPEGGSEDGGRGRRGASPVQNLRAACNAVLHAAEARQEWAAMRRMVHLMTARGLPPDVVTYNVLLKAALRRGDGQVALHEGVAEMTALGLRPNAATYALLMEAHAAAGDVDGAEAAFKEMSAGGTAPDSTAWAALLRAHGMAADLPGLGQAYEELLLQWDDPSIEDLDAVYAAAFEAVRTATAGIRVRARSARHAAGVHHPAADYGEQHLHSGSAKESSESSYQSHENRPAPDAFSYGAALNGGPGAQDAGYRLATALLQRMEGDAQRLLGQGKSLPPPALAALIGAHGNLGHADAVARIVGAAYGPQQQQRGILSGSGIPASKASPPSEGGKSPLKPSARPSIEAQVLEALDLKPPSRKEAALGLTACRSAPDIRVVNAALAAFGRSGRLDLCIALLKRMKSLRLSADAQTYTALILACVSPPMPALARHLLTHAAEAGVPMTIRAYNALLQVVCAAQGVDAYSGVIGIMAEAGVQPDSFTWMALRSAALMQRRPDVAEHADMELRALQHGTHGAKYHAVQSEVVPDDAIGAEDGADGKESGEGDGTAGQKHWKGYYASDDEDEW